MGHGETQKGISQPVENQGIGGKEHNIPDKVLASYVLSLMGYDRLYFFRQKILNQARGQKHVPESWHDSDNSCRTGHGLTSRPDKDIGKTDSLTLKPLLYPFAKSRGGKGPAFPKYLYKTRKKKQEKDNENKKYIKRGIWTGKNPV